MTVAALSIGCGPGCDRKPGGGPVIYVGGTTDTVHGVYESAPPCGPYLDFPGGRTYRFTHALGGVPRIVSTYFAFDEYPICGAECPCNGHPSGFVEASGNQATVQDVGSDHIDVRNDTCSDVRLRITAEAPVLVSTGDAGP